MITRERKWTRKEVADHLSALKRALRRAERGEWAPLALTEAPRIFRLRELEARGGLELRAMLLPGSASSVHWCVRYEGLELPKGYGHGLSQQEARARIAPKIADACRDWIDHLEAIRPELPEKRANTAGQKKGGKHSCRLPASSKAHVLQFMRTFYRRQRGHRNKTEAAGDTLKQLKTMDGTDYLDASTYSTKRIIQLCELKK